MTSTLGSLPSNVRAIPAASPPFPSTCTACWYAAHPDVIPPVQVDGCCMFHLVWTASRGTIIAASQTEAAQRWDRYLAGGRL